MVTEFEPALQALADNMLETMYELKGVGLAAPQVDIPLRLIVVDVSEAKDEPTVLVNPTLSARSGEILTEEGCLSIPGFYETVPRAESISVEARDPLGNPVTVDAEALLSVCIQHEMDHLDGKLFVDYLSRLKRSRIQKQLSKAATRQ